MSVTRSSRLAKRRKSRRTLWLIVIIIIAVLIIVWSKSSILEGGASSASRNVDDGQSPFATEAVNVESNLPTTAITPSPESTVSSVQTTEPTPLQSGNASDSTGNANDPKVSGEGNATPSTNVGTTDPDLSNGSKGATVIPYAPGVFTDPKRIQMTFVGDVLLGSTVDSLLSKNGYDYPYKQVISYLQRPDLTIANLETSITTGGTKQVKEYVFRSSPLVLPAFQAAGFDLVNLANNHSMDYGPDGLLDTFAHLEKQGIPYVGAGRNSAEAFSPVILEKKGMKIAFLGFTRVVPEQSWKAGVSTPGLADTYNYTVPVEAIKKAAKQADLVVVIPHWGVERSDLPVAYQKDLARRYIDAGADLVVASHTHVLQGFESYKGKWIAYSLGNFIFTTNNTPKTWDSMILEASCSQDGDCALNAVPVLTKAAQPKVMLPEGAVQLFSRLSAASFGVKLLEDGQIVRTTK